MSERRGRPPGSPEPPSGEELFRFIVDSAHEYAIFAADVEGRVMSWNPGAERFFGWAEDEILGRSAAVLFTPEDRERGEPERELARAAAEGRSEDERWHLRRDGSRFWMSGMVTPLADDQGRLRGFVKVARDQTEHKRFEDELSLRLREAQEANRLKDEFLATLSHELRTPLTAMLGWSRLLLGGMLDDEGRQRAVETIARNAKSQAQIVEDILDVSRIISGRLRLEVDLVDVGAVVRAAVEAVRPAAAAKEIALAVRADPLVGPVRGDTDRLQQVVWNLLSNAVKFTPRGGQRGAARRACEPARSRSRSSITARASRPTSCPSSSTASGRPTRRPPAGTAASAWGSPSCATSSSCTAAASRRRAPAAAGARRSR